MRRPHFRPLALRPLAAALLLAVLAALAPAAATAQPVRTPQAYLPLIARPATVTLEFATSVNEETFEPINPGTSFPGGTDLIYVVVRLGGLSGRTFKVDLKTPRGDVTGSSSTIPINDAIASRSYCFTANSCEVSREPLPSGVYTAEVYIDGELRGSAQFTIQ